MAKGLIINSYFHEFQGVVINGPQSFMTTSEFYYDMGFFELKRWGLLISYAVFSMSWPFGKVMKDFKNGHGFHAVISGNRLDGLPRLRLDVVFFQLL